LTPLVTWHRSVHLLKSLKPNKVRVALLFLCSIVYCFGSCLGFFRLSSSCVLYAQCCQCLWIVQVSLDCPSVSGLSKCFWIVQVSLDCPSVSGLSKCLWIVHSWLPLWFSLTFIWSVYDTVKHFLCDFPREQWNMVT
jgi:hypothetical protein